MRYAITKRNTPQTHLKPRYTKEMPVRACAEHAHAYACAGGQTLARFARSGAPDSLRCPSQFPPIPSLATLARASCLLRAVETPALRRQGKGKGCAIAYSPLCALFPCATRGRSPTALCWLAAYGLQVARVSGGL